MLTLNEKTYLCDFLDKFIPNCYGTHWDLAEKINYKERGKLLALCYKQKTEELREVVADMATQKGIEYGKN